jgi:hypothetical protein
VDLVAELENLSDSWNRAWFDKDAATVERLMAPDYVYSAPNGQAWNRQTILGIIRSPGYRLHHGAHTERIIRLLGNEAAIIRHHWQGEGTFEGTAFKDDHSCVMVLARLDGHWQVVFEQATARSQGRP